MAQLTDTLKTQLKTTLNRNETAITTKLETTVATKVFSSLGTTLSGITGTDSTAKKKATPSTDKKYHCKYQVANLIIMMGTEKITMDHSNILSIEYMNDYEFNIMALLKVSLRIDVRKKMWILKNKKDILVKFELNKIGMDSDNEKYVTAAEHVWNLEFGVYFNDEDESTDIEAMESRINLNEGKEFQTGNIEGENYFESQNTLDLYLILPELMKASRYSFNKVYSKTTLQNAVGHILTKSGHRNVLMSKFENDEIYKELLLPVNSVYKSLIYLDQYYGLYKAGAIIYYDIDLLYILNSNGKLTVKREDEWTETTFLVTKIADSHPGNGMVRKEGEKIFYPTVSDGDVNPQNFSVSKNASLGSSAKIVVTDTTDVEVHEADQSFTNQRNENVTFIKDKNKFTGSVIKARMEENEGVLYLSGNNLDIKAFTPNKIFKVVFDETSKQKAYGNYTYRLSYSYHFLKLESEGYMSSSHRIILKRTASVQDPATASKTNPTTAANSVLGTTGTTTLKGVLGAFETKLKAEASTILAKEATALTASLTATVTKAVGGSASTKKSTSDNMNRVIGSSVDAYKKAVLSKIKI